MATEPVTRLGIREASASDVAGIRRVAAAANEEFREPFGRILFDAYLANVLDVASRVAVGTVLVADAGGDVLGTITLYADVHDEGMPVRFPAGTAGLRATAVSPDARGQGIGGELVRDLVERARLGGARRIALHTAWCMGAAMRLYEREGFRRAPEYDYVANDFFAAGAGERLDAIAFVLDLEDAG